MTGPLYVRDGSRFVVYDERRQHTPPIPVPVALVDLDEALDEVLADEVDEPRAVAEWGGQVPASVVAVSGGQASTRLPVHRCAHGHFCRPGGPGRGCRPCGRGR